MSSMCGLIQQWRGWCVISSDGFVTLWNQPHTFNWRIIPHPLFCFIITQHEIFNRTKMPRHIHENNPMKTWSPYLYSSCILPAHGTTICRMKNAYVYGFISLFPTLFLYVHNKTWPHHWKYSPADGVSKQLCCTPIEQILFEIEKVMSYPSVRTNPALPTVACHQQPYAPPWAPPPDLRRPQRVLRHEKLWNYVTWPAWENSNVFLFNWCLYSN